MQVFGTKGAYRCLLEEQRVGRCTMAAPKMPALLAVSAGYGGLSGPLEFSMKAACVLQGLAVADFKTLAYRDDHHPPRKGELSS